MDFTKKRKSMKIHFHSMMLCSRRCDMVRRSSVDLTVWLMPHSLNPNQPLAIHSTSSKVLSGEWIREYYISDTLIREMWFLISISATPVKIANRPCLYSRLECCPYFRFFSQNFTTICVCLHVMLSIFSTRKTNTFHGDVAAFSKLMNSIHEEAASFTVASLWINTFFSTRRKKHLTWASGSYCWLWIHLLNL